MEIKFLTQHRLGTNFQYINILLLSLYYQITVNSKSAAQKNILKELSKKTGFN